MKTLSLSISNPLLARFEKIAEKTEQSVKDCLGLAVMEFVEHWEMHLADIERMEDDVVHVAFQRVNETHQESENTF